MSLTASMWTSVSGLLAHGEKMNVIGNNISNVNTLGYKNQRMDFQDFVYQYVGTASGMGQVGRGTNIGIIMNDFSQGSLETTTSSTDIAIAGNGFFKVKPKTNNTEYYTRAGNFTFDREGFLVDPHGYVLQGWAIDRNFANQVDTSRSNTKGIVGTGSPVDIKLDTFTCPPRHTTNVTMPLNLDNKTVKSQDDKSTSETNPFFALLANWDATQEVPLGSSMYAYQSTMEVYDEAGKMHKLTVYFDRVVDGHGNQTINGNSIGEDYWEFIVTMDPSEDVRDFSSSYDPTGTSPTQPNVPEKLKGLLGAGTITFDSSGTMKDMSFFVPQSNPNENNGAWWDANENVNLDKFVAAPLSTNGFPLIAPNFSGTAGLQNAYGYDEAGTIITNKPNVNADGRLIALDFGLRSTSSTWTFLGAPDGTMPATYVDNGVATNLVSAGGMSSSITRPVQDSSGRYVWAADDPNVVSVTAPAGVTPTGPWTAAGNNASEYYWDIAVPGTVLGGTSPVSVTTTNGTTPTVSWAAANPPHNATQYSFTSGSGVTGTFETLNNAALVDPSTLTWSAAPDTTTNPGFDIYTSGNYTMTVPTGTFTNPSDISGETWGTGTPTGTYDTFWVGTVAGAGTTITIQQPNTNPAPTPADAVATATGTNVSEYYWTDASGTRVTTSANTPPLATTTWTAQTENVIAANKYLINGMDGMSELQPTCITSYEGGFYEHNGFKQDGYTYGDLRYVSVSTDGVLSAAYSNGVTLQLFQITLHDFPSNQNLRREGGNLFTETRESGVPSSGAAGTGTFGDTVGNSLEQSNTDLSREFVNMITTQRGFQANSKAITTVDTMLEVVISMKR